MVRTRSPAGSGAFLAAASSRGGYMLVEMVAALALTGLLLAFVLPMVPRGTSAPRFLGLVALSASLLRDARSDAIAQARSVSTAFDAHTRQLRTGSQGLAIPADVEVSLIAGGNCPADADRRAALVFRSDGTNCGGVFRFASRGRVMRLRVDWVDGSIDVLQGG